ncbi:SRPBCC domain-containing protein [Paenibacillus sp. J2TS4]|uniref:SRPBCC domain-containing protein n=1 Tax=Paenibacillus sp. J2TS4 TaxID=2807194 RepID=UPI001B111B1B|nr:SRPBCC domain-containing protein [Paenibacillus sp. J2TS4]GIP32027.1 ATPase [Paenibacillus sp. J2TS4]
MDYSARATLRIAKPISEVFEAVVNPVKLCQYFTDYASGRLEPNRIVQWRFDEYESTPKVQVVEVIPEEKIVFLWPGSGVEGIVTMRFEAENDSTKLSIVEEGLGEGMDGFERSRGQTFGWTFMLCCLKAYMEYGINLRKSGMGDIREVDQGPYRQ